MAILLNDRELEALTGLPMLAFRAYVAAIRPRMDLRTGFVGRIVRISYQALIEWCYVEPIPGVQREALTVDKMYRAVRVLERAGLVRIASEKAAKRLIFQCHLAETISYAQNKAATRPRLEAATDESSIFNGFGQMGATDENSQAATHRREEKKHISVASSSSTEPQQVDSPCGGEYVPQEIAPQGGADGPHGDNAMPLEVQPTFALEAQEKQSAKGQGLVFPSSLNAEQCEAIAAKVSKLGSRSQIVVDELAGHMSNREIKNPVRYVDFIISKAILPVWVPELAGAIRAARERSAAARRPAIQEGRSPIVKNPEAAAALLQILKQRMTNENVQHR